MQQTQSEINSSSGSVGGGNNGGGAQRSSLSLRDIGLRLAGLAFIDAVAFWFAITLYNNNIPIGAVVLVLVTILVNWIFLSDRLYPLRWITPGALLMLLMVVYPACYTIFVSFTNYGSGHIVTQQQAVDRINDQNQTVTANFAMTVYRNPGGNADQPESYKIILQDAKNNKVYLGDTSGVKPYTQVQANTPRDQLPATLDGFSRLSVFQAAAAASNDRAKPGALRKLNLKTETSDIEIVDGSNANEQGPRFTYNASDNTLTDKQNPARVFKAVKGTYTYTAPDGKKEELSPGYVDVVGGDNYAKVFADNNITGPFLGVFLWTLLFAAGSVLLSFAIGLGLALVLNDPQLPLRTFFRTVSFIPYAIPSFISALIWAGLFQINGPLGLFSKTIFGSDFSWFSDGNAAKIMILFINMWLGFPYMMLISLGALQSIPTDMYEAANLDGASGTQKFWYLTFPLLLVSLAPLLVGSFAYNFNNFNVIQLTTRGGPDDPSTTTPAGKTDILISYTFRLAFATGKGQDLGLASTISLFIFLLVAGITAFNFRFTKRLEGVFN